MKMQLVRTKFSAAGIIGTLKPVVSKDPNFVFATLEHAYPHGINGFRAKVIPGEYTCRKGIHQLSRGGPFETFEVEDVPGHWGILFHKGNFNQDSDGCILLGQVSTDTGLLRSHAAFTMFMRFFGPYKSFQLSIVEKPC